MKDIKAIIADDEEQLRRFLKARLKVLWPDLIICGEAGNGPEAMNLIETCQPDIAFLDIRMPGFSGIKVAEKAAGKCRVVFISAYDQYALQAFENEALDYIVKPVTDKRLEKTVKRLKKEVREHTFPTLDLVKMIESLTATLDTRKDSGHINWIKAQHGEGVRLISVNEIFYFRAQDKYTAVMTGDTEYLIRKSIRDLVADLDPGQFWQIHRGTIVNVKKIDKVTRGFSGGLMIRLKDLPGTLSVSRAYSHLFKQM